MKRNENFLYGLLITLALLFAGNSFLLHTSAEKLEQAKQHKLEIRQEIFAELDSMAWNYQVDDNRRYVLNQDHVFRCETLRQYIKQNLKK